MAAAFLGALIDSLADNWDEKSGVNFGLGDTESESRREAFFSEVVHRANKMLADNEAFLADARAWIKSLGETTKGPPNAPSTYNDLLKAGAPEWHQKLFNYFCRAAFERLSSKIKDTGNDKFFLALDECTALKPAGADERAPLKRISLIALQRILKAAEVMSDPVCFWFLLLDTNSSVVMLLPSGPSAPSWRLLVDLAPLPPFVYLGFNQHLMLMRKEKPSDSLSLGNLKNTGRPVRHIPSL